MATTRKQRDHLAKRAPESINATTEDLAEAFQNVPPDHQWDFPKDDKKEGAPK